MISENCGFVANGRENLFRGLEQKIRSDIQQRYQDHLGMTWFQRWRLRRKIEAEVKHLLERELERVSAQSLF